MGSADQPSANMREALVAVLAFAAFCQVNCSSDGAVYDDEVETLLDNILEEKLKFSSDVNYRDKRETATDDDKDCKPEEDAGSGTDSSFDDIFSEMSIPGFDQIQDEGQKKE